MSAGLCVCVCVCDCVYVSTQRYGGSGGEKEESEMYVDVKPVEMVGTDQITKKQR